MQAGLGDLELDCTESPATPALDPPPSKRRKGLVAADGNDDGPKSVADSFNWALHFIGSMYLLGLLSIGIDLGERLLNTLRAGLEMVTDYSGMGCPEEALRLICRAFEEDVTIGVWIRS